jgi:hypothetical protein
MTRYLLALPRALALMLLSAVGAFVASVTILLLALVVPYPLLVAAVRRLAQLGRRLARDWCGVEIRAGYAPPPAPPQRRADGWYAYENQLYRSPWWPTFMAKLTAYSKDHTYTRDWIWLALGPVGAAIVAVPLGLVAGGVAVLAGVLEMPWSVPIGVVLGHWTSRGGAPPGSARGSGGR